MLSEPLDTLLETCPLVSGINFDLHKPTCVYVLTHTLKAHTHTQKNTFSSECEPIWQPQYPLYILVKLDN